MFFGWIDQIAASTLAVPGAIATLPGGNLQVNPVRRHARVTGTAMTIDFDFGAAVAWRVFGLAFAGQGFDPTAAATIRITLSATASGDTDVHDTGTVALNFSAGHGQAFHALASSFSARYGRVVLTDATLSSVDLGRLVGYGGAGFWEPSRKHEFGRAWRPQDLTGRRRTLGGNLRRRVGRTFRRVELILPGVPETEMFDNALAADLAVGLVGDVMVMLRPASEPTRESLWGPLATLTPIVNTSPLRETKRYLIEQEL